jgi:ectoine hydroxylase-related dioxygenase (phytanoyl-CoA dioxygenase family)
MAPHGLTDTQVRQYREEGYLILPGVFRPEEIERMRQEADRILALMLNSSLALGEVNPRLDLRTRNGQQVVRKVQPINDLSAVLRAVSEDPRLLQPMRDLLGSEPLLMEEKLNYKEALAHPVDLPCRPDDDAFPFHHDWGYYQAQGYPKETLSSAVSIDESTPDNGPIRVVPGSHRREWPLNHEGKGPEIAEGVFGAADAQDVLAPAGSVMLFHSALVHHSGPNQTAAPRRIMIYSHYPSWHLAEPDARNRNGRRRGQEHERRYRDAVEAGASRDRWPVGDAAVRPPQAE